MRGVPAVKDLWLLLLGMALILPWVAWAGAPAVTDLAAEEEPRAAFQVGVVLAVSGKLEEASEHFAKAALSNDRPLAARAHYNLGALTVRRAQALWGSDPEAAPLAVREAGSALLDQAMVHYRDALQQDGQFQDARYNLELIHLWKGRMRAQWSQRDRREARRRLGALEMLAQLISEERFLREQSGGLAKERDSNGRRELARGLGRLQLGLSEEIVALQEKIALALETPVSEWPEPINPLSLSASPEEQEEVDLEGELCDLAEDAQHAMETAGKLLERGSLEEALSHQTRATELLDEIHLGLVPFPRLLAEAIQLQRHLIEEVAPRGAKGETAGASHLSLLTWDQEFLGWWAQWLPEKAKQSQRIWEAVRREQAASEESPAVEEDLAPCVEKVVAAAPRLQELTDAAAVELQAGRPQEALTKQRETLALLETVLALLPARVQATLDEPPFPPPSFGERPEQAPSAQPPELPLPENARPALMGSVPERPSSLSTMGTPSSSSIERRFSQVRQRQRQRRALELQFQGDPRTMQKQERDW